MRHRAMRGLHRASRRHGRAIVRDARRGGRREARDHDRRAVAKSEPRRATSLDRRGRAPVRLLPVGSDHGRRRAARQEPQAQRRRHRRRHDEHLPLRHLPADPRRRPSRGAGGLMERREFLQTASVVGAGLVIGFYLPPGRGRVPAATGPFAPNAWLRIGTDESVLVMVDRSEMGQGVATSLPMLVAEELEADWSKIKIEFAPADKAYTNPMFGMQGTGGSTSVRAAFTPLRKAGAAARELLVAAAAQTWSVDKAECRAERGAVIHTPSKRRLTYGKLAAKAAALPAPAEVPLKDPKDWKILGTRVRRLDTPPKVDGSAQFGIDVRIPGMLVAVIARCPVFGGKVARFDATKARAGSKLDAVYEAPFLAHATMEPMNCTAHVRPDGGGVDIWAPTQFQTGCQQLGAGIGGVAPEKVQVHTTYLGGGFGRRFELDFIQEALEASKAAGAPVKVIWSREDDIRQAQYRPACYHRFRAGLDATGQPVAWSHRIVAPSIFARVFPQTIKNGLDGEAVEGGVGMPYTIPNVHVDYLLTDTGIPVGFWRSVNNSYNAFAVECFIDEVAHAAKRDPYEYRRDLLTKAPRHLGVLNLAASKAGWGTAPPAGRARGLAVYKSFETCVAEVAEVSVASDGAVRVHRVVCAVDCGPVVNPDIVEAQMQSGIVYGLTAALWGEITIDKGRVQQSNFHDYRMLRLAEMPHIEVHIVPSSDAQGGVGEPGTPPIAPAVCNAIFALTGKRIRKLPIGKIV